MSTSLVRGNFRAFVSINDPGQIVGTSETTNGSRHAFLWQNGRLRDLSPVATVKYSSARAINERGQIVGTVNKRITGGLGEAAVMWTIANGS